MNPIRRTGSFMLVMALSLGLLAIGFLDSSSALGGATSAPSSGPTSESAEKIIHDEIADITKELEISDKVELDKIAALEKTLVAELKADPSIRKTPEFTKSFIKRYGDCLTGEDLKKFNQMMAMSMKYALELKTATNLRQVGNALIGFMANSGKWPDDLGVLSFTTLAPDTFLVGGSKTQVPANWSDLSNQDRAKWIKDNTDFVYLKPTIEGNAGLVIAYIKPDISPDTNILLMANITVHRLDAQHNKAVIDELKAGKNPPPSMPKE
jgi:hypothetical protein